MNRYIIAYLVKGEVKSIHENLVDRVSKEFNLRKITTSSHITLKHSFHNFEIKDVEEKISQTILECKEFGNIQIEGIHSFRDDIFFIKANLDPKASEFYFKLLSKLKEIPWMEWDPFDGDKRKFHMTITNRGYLLTDPKLLRKFLANYNPEFILPFDNITILRKLEDERQWVIEKEFVLNQ